MNPMIRSSAIYGALLSLALAGAWVRYTAEPALELDGKVLLLQGTEDELTEVIWTSEGKDKAVITRKTDARGDYYEVVYTRWTEKKAPKVTPTETPAGPTTDPVGPEAPGTDPATPADPNKPPEAADPAKPPEPAPIIEESVQTFKAGEEGAKLATSVSPMLAIRKLEGVDAEKLATTGLDAPKEFLEISRKGKTVKLEVGGEVYGTRDRYVKNSATGEIYLVDDELLRPLKYARTRLPDRAVFGIEAKKITKAVLSASGTSRVLSQKNAQDAEKSTWVREDRPTEADEQLQTWMEKILKLKNTGYAEKDDATEGLVLAFTLQIEDEKGVKETLEVFKDAEGKQWWARSEFTRGWVKMLKGPTADLSDDVATLVGG